MYWIKENTALQAAGSSTPAHSAFWKRPKILRTPLASAKVGVVTATLTPTAPISARNFYKIFTKVMLDIVVCPAHVDRPMRVGSLT